MRVQVDHPFFADRLRFIMLFTGVMISVLFLRLWYMQGFRGSYYRDQSENNRTRQVRTAAPRGTIYDREGRILVRNRPEFDIALLLEDIPDLKLTLSRLAEITGRTEGSLKAQLADKRKYSPFEPKVVIPDVSREELAKIKTLGYRLPGVIVVVNPTRSYPHKSLAAQLLGYTREITKSQLETPEGQKYYRLGDMTGQTGVEKGFEKFLRGRSGYRIVEVDAMGNRRKELGEKNSRPGRDLYLTIDYDMQQAAEDALGEDKGAVVALDPRNGDVLVLASAPSFDDNIFSGEVHNEELKSVLSDKRHPLSNRAIAATYAPGSTFKLIMATAGLAEKKITPQTTFNCPGYYYFAGRKYHCHKKTGHGTVDLATAITVSCDSYFYQLGQLLGVNKIHDYAADLGLGTITGIEIPGEKKGTLPSEGWKLRRFGQRWYPGETLSVAIGQGYVTATPLEMAVSAAGIANDGIVFQPNIVKKIVSTRTGKVKEIEPHVMRKVDVSSEIFQKVREDAVLVVSDQRGTGRKAALPGISVGGKTGTAQVVTLGKESLGKQYQDHAWFIAFAPAEKPTIAIAVVVENGGHGGATAAPISQKVMEIYFRKLGMLPPLEEKPGQSGHPVDDEALAD